MGAKIELDIYTIYSEHCRGVSVSYLSKKYSVSRETLFRRFKSLGLKTKTKMSLYNAQSENIIRLYISNNSIQDISLTLSIPVTQVWRVLKSNNIKATEQYNYVNKFNKYEINEYFDTIDTPNKAYFLGLLYADGNVNRKLNQITLKLKASDVHILNDIKYEFGINGPLYKDRPKNPRAENQLALKIINKRTKDNFIRHGVIPRKTWRLSFPFWLPQNLRSHFVRGYFDGDGCLYIDRNRNNASFDICGTYNMCSDLEFVLKNSIGVCTQISKDRNIFRIRIRRYIDVVAVCNWMYYDAKLFLKRKYDKYQEIRSMNVRNVL
ncbi:hypothetical protein M0R72_02500 [Candidatus Pacearchaeota archaeon]|jgi:hypothetical protein|nr:hypothetical protein [Candidatus Pacearchaeota archaeon]